MLSGATGHETGVGHTSLSGCDGKSYERSSAKLYVAPQGRPSTFPRFRTRRPEDRPGTGGAVSLVTAAGVGVMISCTPHISGRDREVGRDEVSRRARDEPGSRVLPTDLG